MLATEAKALENIQATIREYLTAVKEFRELLAPLASSTMQSFDIVGEITDIETIAVGQSVKDSARLRKQYGPGRWRNLKGIAMIRLKTGRIRKAEVHWYEANGLGRKEIKRKRYLGGTYENA